MGYENSNEIWDQDINCRYSRLLLQQGTPRARAKMERTSVRPLNMVGKSTRNVFVCLEITALEEVSEVEV